MNAWASATVGGPEGVVAWADRTWRSGESYSENEKKQDAGICSGKIARHHDALSVNESILGEVDETASCARSAMLVT